MSDIQVTSKKVEIELLEQIHKLATNDDWMTVPFKIDQLEMARLAIEKAEKAFSHIADLTQVIFVSKDGE